MHESPICPHPPFIFKTVKLPETLREHSGHHTPISQIHQFFYFAPFVFSIHKYG